MKDNPVEALEYILGQDCIDKHIFKTEFYDSKMGIACGCEDDIHYTCIFALVHRIKQKKVVERIPDYQDYAGTCASKCPFGTVSSGPSPFFMYEGYTSFNSCPDGTYHFLSDNGASISDPVNEYLCQSCQERYPGCSTCGCDPNIGLSECLGSEGIFAGHSYRAAVLGGNR